MINSDGVLKDVCGSANMCLNGGVCSLINDEPTCDCSQTGFQGKDCSEGKTSDLAKAMRIEQRVLHSQFRQMKHGKTPF